MIAKFITTTDYQKPWHRDRALVLRYDTPLGKVQKIVFSYYTYTETKTISYINRFALEDLDASEIYQQYVFQLRYQEGTPPKKTFRCQRKMDQKRLLRALLLAIPK